MISVIVPLEMFTDFVGGAEIHSNEVIKRLSKITDVLILPYFNNITNFNNKKICETYRNLPYHFPKIIHRLCSGEKIKFSDAVRELSEEAKQTDLIYEPSLRITLNVGGLKDKIRLAVNSLKIPVYCSEDIVFDSFCIAKRSGKRLVSVIQSDIKSYFEGLRILYYGIRYHFNDPLIYLKNTYTYRNVLKMGNLIKDPLFKNLLSVSQVVRNLGIRSEKIKILKVANAFDKDILKYRTKKKEDYIVFGTRLYSLKGILEVPYIIKEISKEYGDIKLKLFGNFHYNAEKEYFFSLVKKLNVERNIEYLGSLKENRYEVISRARAVLYPSHADSFSLVILESLALGTPVVAYDLLGPRSVYEGLSAVKFVEEFDVKGMAREILKLLNMKDEDYYALIYNDSRLDNFLEQHDSWDKVFEEISVYIFD